jgi:acyl-CoA reductase-like NAD-dependent aldehyde dehydrogenase
MTHSQRNPIRPFYLNGQWVQSPETLDVVNPAMGEVFARVGTIGRDLVAHTFFDASEAWRTWRTFSGKHRGTYLLKITEALSKCAEEVARTITLENGKPLAESLEAGTIGINDTVPATSQCPFGDMKQSGWGRELGTEGLDAFLETKHISLGVQA